MDATSTIALDHPVDVNGIAIRFVPIRPATAADFKAARRAAAKKWRRAEMGMVAAIAAEIEADDPDRERKVATGFVACAIVRAVTGLPFSAIAQLTADDHTKIAAFLDSNTRA